jgi:hypothetical protein
MWTLHDTLSLAWAALLAFGVLAYHYSCGSL